MLLLLFLVPLKNLINILWEKPSISSNHHFLLDRSSSKTFSSNSNIQVRRHRLRILISFGFIQTMHLYSSWGSVLMFPFILLSVDVFPFIMMLGKLGQTSELYVLFVVTLISVTANFLVMSQLLRKLSATLMGLTLMSDISSSPEECSCHGRWWSGRLRPSFSLPRPVECWHFEIRTNTLSFKAYSAGSQHWKQGWEWCIFDGQGWQAVTGCCILENREIWKKKVRKE